MSAEKANAEVVASMLCNKANQPCQALSKMSGPDSWSLKTVRGFKKMAEGCSVGLGAGHVPLSKSHMEAFLLQLQH